MPDITITIPGCSCCASPAPCTVCSSSNSVLGPTGPNWTAILSSTIDRYVTNLTAAQQAVGALLSGTPLHNNLDGVSLTLTGSSLTPTTLRSGAYGSRTYALTASDAATIAPYWDEIATAATGGACGAIDTYAGYIANGYVVSGSIIESAGVAVYCPENGLVDTSGTKLGVYCTYLFAISLSLASSVFSTTLTASRTLTCGTYIETLLTSIGCPVNLTLSQATNPLLTNSQLDQTRLALNFSTTCYLLGGAVNYPLGGSLLLTE